MALQQRLAATLGQLIGVQVQPSVVFLVIVVILDRILNCDTFRRAGFTEDEQQVPLEVAQFPDCLLCRSISVHYSAIDETIGLEPARRQTGFREIVASYRHNLHY